MRIYCQEIRTTWSKASRHATPARLRAAVPALLALPAHQPAAGAATVVHHIAWFREEAGFQLAAEHLKQMILEPYNGFHTGCVRLARSGTEVQVIYTWSASVGAPARTSGRARCLRSPPARGAG